MLSPLKDVHEYFCHNKADEAAAWEGEDPGEHHILYDAKVDGRDPLHRSHAHDGAGLCVGGGHRDPEQAGIKKAESAGYVGGKALVPLQLYHVHAHGFNDLFSAHAGSQGHDHAA